MYKISKYKTNWPKEFENIKQLCMDILNEKALLIEHVCSTSIPNMTAKPLIDVLIVVNKIECLDEEIQKFKVIGYEILKNKLDQSSYLLTKEIDGMKIQNIHIIEEGSEVVNQFLIMKEYYLHHKEVMQEYSDLKIELFEKFPNDYKSYREGKTSLLNRIEKDAREWANTPPNILTDNGLFLFKNGIKYRGIENIIEINIEELIWHLDMPVWEKDYYDYWNLIPREVINNEYGTSIHRKRVNDADLKYPIIVTKYKGKWVILDGIHRLVKAVESDEKHMKARVVMNPELRKDSHENI